MYQWPWLSSSAIIQNQTITENSMSKPLYTCFNMSFIKLNNAATIINNDDIIPALLMYLQRCKACYKYNQVLSLSLSLWSKIIHLLKTICHKQYIPLIVWEVSSCIYYIQHSIYPKQFDVRLAENGIKFHCYNSG